MYPDIFIAALQGGVFATMEGFLFLQIKSKYWTPVISASFDV